MLPALIAWVTRCRSDDVVIWIYRVIGSCALGGCGAILWRICRSLRGPVAASLACVGLFAFDAKSVDFTASGMETPYLLVFMAWQAFLFFTNGSTGGLGVAWAGMMMSRPDAFIQIGSFYAAALIFSGSRDQARNLALKAVRAGALAAVLYLPWLVWSAGYYGSPKPHTILAKGLHSPAGFARILKSVMEASQRMITTGIFHRVIFAPPIWNWAI